MKVNNVESDILNAIQTLEKKIDGIAEQIKTENSPERLDGETIAVITAAAYNLFGRRVAVKNVRLLDDNPTGKKRFRQFSVVGYR
ncbi:hypothetical protein SDC9_102625 [bioreactor metagenome]|uniref:Uncharacterized protein n=1 Tax=bioreactor metagenome TaxID=1076179 RepID=A0A645ASU3_9ZZZZ